MAWSGAASEAARDKAKIELSLARAPLYRLRMAVNAVEHIDKGPRLRKLMADVYAALDAIEFELGR